MPHFAGAVKDFCRSFARVSARQPPSVPGAPPVPPRVEVVQPGPPGIGKTRTALEIAVRHPVHLLQPSHALADEREREARPIANQIRAANALAPLPGKGNNPRRVKRVQGMRRNCDLKRSVDERFEQMGWAHGTLACVGCPVKRTCRSRIQFFPDTQPTSVFGVHEMSGWRPETQVHDEHPQWTDSFTYKFYDLQHQLGSPSLHPVFEGWRVGIHTFIQTISAAVMDKALDEDLARNKHGIPLNVSRVFPDGSPQLDALIGIVDYFTNIPMPSPPPMEVRSGLSADDWGDQRWGFFFTALLAEARQTPLPRRANLKFAICQILVAGTPKRATDIRYVVTYRNPPKFLPAMVLDSTAHLMIPAYQAYYENFDLKLNIKNSIKPDAQWVHATHVETKAFASSRLFEGNQLTDHGKNSLKRFLHDIAVRGLGINHQHAGQARVGLVLRKKLVEYLGLPGEGVWKSERDAMKAVDCPDPEINTLFRELKDYFQLRIGYYGGIAGSNEFEDVDIIALVSDPWVNLHASTAEALCLGINPKEHAEALMQAEAIQGIYRCRPLNADQRRQKHIFYYGAHHPEIGVPWTLQEWAAGGQIPRPYARAAEISAARRLRQRTRPEAGGFILGRWNDEALWAHTTSDERPLQELRAKQARLGEAPSRAELASYQRAAQRVADLFGLRQFERAHPFSSRPMVVFAGDEKAADRAERELAAAVRLMPPHLQRPLAAKMAVQAAAEAVDDLVLEAVEQVRAEITAEKQSMVETLKSLSDPTPEAVQRVRHASGSRVRVLLGRWRALRGWWRSTSGLTPEALGDQAQSLPLIEEWVKTGRIRV